MNKALSVMKSSSDDVAANMLHMIAKNSAPDLMCCYTHTCTYLYTRIHMHICVHTYIHIYTYMYIYYIMYNVYTHALFDKWLCIVVTV